MKTISVTLLLLLVGCAPSTPDLIKQAHLTGDWTLVNARMESLERREAQQRLSCPRGTTEWCDGRFGRATCSCVRNDVSRSMMASIRR